MDVGIRTCMRLGMRLTAVWPFVARGGSRRPDLPLTRRLRRTGESIIVRLNRSHGAQASRALPGVQPRFGSGAAVAAPSSGPLVLVRATLRFGHPPILTPALALPKIAKCRHRRDP